jgi:putative protease
MNIISPIDNLAETDALLDAGADELYGGYVPEAWQERYSLLTSVNQRTFAGAQIEGRDDLSAIIAKAHARGKTFSLTLNAPFYSAEQLPLILDYVDEVAAAGVDGVILADLGLLRELRRRHPRLEYHASTLAHLMNSEAVKIYASQGIGRVVFPRHLTVEEMGEVVRHVPDVRFDAFLLVGKCPNTEGLCTFHHSSPDRIWPCEIPYRISPLQVPASERLLQAMTRQGSWSMTDRRHGCGLCAIPYLRRIGIGGLKIVGRGAPTAQKLKNIQLAGDFLRLADESDDFAVYRRLAMAAHRRRFGTPCSPNVCYFPEFYQAD